MYTKLCVLLLAVGLSQAMPKHLAPETNLMQFMMKSRDLTQDNPARSVSCFDTYMPELNQISEDYQAAYAACIATGEAATEAIEESTKSDRNNIAQEADDACSTITACSSITESADFFNCYIDAGTSNSKAMYTISSDSQVLLAKFLEDIRQIEYTQNVCTNQTERDYVEKSTFTYGNLDRCLRGLEPLTTAAPESTTVSVPTDSSSIATESSESTTAASEPTDSSTDSSVVTESSESTTAASEATSEPESDEKMPEEDLSRHTEQENKIKQMVNEMKKLFSRRH